MHISFQNKKNQILDQPSKHHVHTVTIGFGSKKKPHYKYVESISFGKNPPVKENGKLSRKIL